MSREEPFLSSVFVFCICVEKEGQEVVTLRAGGGGLLLPSYHPPCVNMVSVSIWASSQQLAHLYLYLYLYLYLSFSTCEQRLCLSLFWAPANILLKSVFVIVMFVFKSSKWSKAVISHFYADLSTALQQHFSWLKDHKVKL